MTKATPKVVDTDDDSFLDAITKDEYTSFANERRSAAEVFDYVETGSYTFNLITSGSIFSGIPCGRTLAFAGEEATGKTFFTMDIISNIKKSIGKTVTLYYDTEAAVDKQQFESRGVDSRFVVIKDADTIEYFRTDAMQNLDRYIKDKPPMRMVMVLDSLGNISTEKEMTDIASGSDKRDMTKAQLIKGTFRAITRKCGRAKVPLIITNHVYDVVGSYVPLKQMAGGSGLKYAASIVLFLSKKKDSEEEKKDPNAAPAVKGEKKKTTKKNVLGSVITITAKKSRFVKENAQVEVKLSHDHGIDRYYGLLDIAVKYGIVTKLTNKYQFPNVDGLFFESVIYKDPERFFTPDFLNLFEEKVSPNFRYGGIYGEDDDFEVEEDDE